MQAKQKTIIFLPDGMADEPLESLSGKTPLQVAHTPGMDWIAKHGISGTLKTLPEGYPTSSDVANMSVLGCSLEKEFSGRGVLEASSLNIEMGADDVAFRCNLINVDADGRVVDYSAGQIKQPHASALMRFLAEKLGNEKFRFHTGVSYRNVCILHGAEFSEKVYCKKPDDNVGNLVTKCPPVALEAEAEKTVAILLSLAKDAAGILPDAPANHDAVKNGVMPANAIWFWSPGKSRPFRTLLKRHGITSAVISAVDTINGLGRCLGMNVIKVPGATGFIDTNYAGKAAATIEAIKTHDLVYVHVEAIDEVSHMQDLDLKIKSIEDFDAKIVTPVINSCGDSVRYVVLPDHPVPIAIGKHTRTPVPVSVCGPGIVPDSVCVYDESAALSGNLGAMEGSDLMIWLFG